MGREVGEKERAIRPQYRSEHEWRKVEGKTYRSKLPDCFEILREVHQGC